MVSSAVYGNPELDVAITALGGRDIRVIIKYGYVNVKVSGSTLKLYFIYL